MMDGKRKREEEGRRKGVKSSVSQESVGFLLVMFGVGQNNVLNH